MTKNQTSEYILVSYKYCKVLLFATLMCFCGNQAYSQIGAPTTVDVMILSADTCQRMTGSLRWEFQSGNPIAVFVTNMNSGTQYFGSANDPQLFENLPAGNYVVDPIPGMDFDPISGEPVIGFGISTIVTIGATNISYVTNNLVGCGSYTFNGTNYTQSTTLQSTVTSGNCIEHHTTNIQIFPTNNVHLNSSNNNFNCNDSSLLSITGNNINHIQSINWIHNGVSFANNTSNILVVTAGGNGNGNGLNQFNRPLGIAYDAQGNMYVSDYNNSRVLKFPPNSTSITQAIVIAGGNGSGNGLNQLTRPAGIFVQGNFLYVCDYDNFRVMKYPINPLNNSGAGVIAAKNGLSYNNEVFVTAAGEIYVSEHTQCRVSKFAANSDEFTQGVVVAGSTVGTIVGALGATCGNNLNQLNAPVGIWVANNGDLYIADRHNHRIVKWVAGATSGIVVAGGNGQGSALNQFDHPVDIAFDAIGNMYVSEEQGARVMYFQPNSNSTSYGFVYMDNTFLNFVGHIAFNADGNLNISDGGNYRVVMLNKIASNWVHSTGTYFANVTFDNGCPETVGPIQINSNVLATTDTMILTACDSLIYKQIIYTNSSTLFDTLKTVENCDSIYRFVMITINHLSTSTTNTTICTSALPYIWNGNSYNAAGTYIVILTNAVGCDSVATLNLTVSSAPVSQTINLAGCNNVLYNSNSYNTSTILNETLQNIYGCDSVYKTINIIVNANPVLQIQIPIDSCATTATTISTSVSYNTYSWALPNGSILNTSTITGSQAGIYQLTVTNSQGCSATASFALLNCIQPSITIIGDSILCGGEGTSEITAIIAGYPNATFEWTDPYGGTSSSNPIAVNNGSEGLYTLVATLPNGSTITKTINISSTTAITYSVTGQNLCTGATVGSFDITTTGGTAPYTYAWTNNVTSAINTNEDQFNIPYNQGFYGTITDANGCSTVANMYFQVHSPVAVFVNGTTLPCGVTSGNITISATGGLPFYDTSGNPYYIGTGIQNLSVGNYTIYVKDSIGCETAATFSVTAPCVCSIPQVSISTDFSQTGIRGGKVYYCYGAALTLTGSLINSATYSWTGPNGFTATTRTIQINPAKPINSGRYTVTASLNASCFSTGYVDVVVLPQLVVTTSSSISVCPNTPVTLSATASSTPVTFYWTYNFATVNPTTFIATNANQGVYLVKAVDAYKCSGISTLKVNLLPVPAPVISGALRVCVGSTIQLAATPTGGVWTSLNNRAGINTNTGVLTGLTGGGASIGYTVTNTNGCSAFTNYNVTVNAIPAIPTITYAPGTPNPQYGAGAGNYCLNRTFGVVGTPSGGIWLSSNNNTMTVSPLGIANTIGLGSASLTYTIINNGCSNSRSITGNVVGCANRSNFTNAEVNIPNNDFILYPNPAKNILYLKIERLVGQGKLILYDILGKEVLKQNLSIGLNEINISNLKKGIYLTSIITNLGIQTKKIIVE